MTNTTARQSICRGCSGALTWAGHYWVHADGARLCYAERERVTGSVSTYCGNYPELSHADCPSSVECTAVTVEYLATRPTPARAARSAATGHRFDCPVYSTLDASDCDCA